MGLYAAESLEFNGFGHSVFQKKIQWIMAKKWWTKPPVSGGRRLQLHTFATTAG